jgi:pimeloyl-ACP methyl ester carboxylesterase
MKKQGKRKIAGAVRRPSALAFGMMIVLIIVLTSCASVQSKTGASLPFDETGVLGDAAYRIRVPEEWNGTLVVFCHGYRPVIGGGTEPAIAHRPNYEVTGTPGDIDTEIEEALINEGYALAGSSYSSNGYAVSEAIAETLELTNYFKSKVGSPDKVLLSGFSMGGLIVTKLVEMYPETYDGALSACGVVGTNLLLDEWLAFRLAFDVAFEDLGGFPSEWGSVEEIREDFLFLAEGMPVYLDYIMNETNFGRFEFIRLVLGTRIEDFYQPAETYVPAELAIPGALGDMWFATDPYAEVVSRLGGLPAQNTHHVYTLQDDPTIDDEQGYLAGFGIDAKTLLAEMNARTTYSADPAARAKVKKSWEMTGRITRPVLRLHTFADSIVLPSQISVLKEIVSAAGQEANLAVVFTDGVGHCIFSSDQEVAAIRALDNWVSTGRRPDARNDEVFPADLGFLHDFDVPPWPF